MMPDYSHESNLPKKGIARIKVSRILRRLSLNICGNTLRMSVGIICRNFNRDKV